MNIKFRHEVAEFNRHTEELFARYTPEQWALAQKRYAEDMEKRDARDDSDFWGGLKFAMTTYNPEVWEKYFAAAD